MVVFLLVLGLGNARPLYRPCFLVLFALFFLHIGRWETFLFTCGPILAELRISRMEAQKVRDSESQTHAIHSEYSNSRRGNAWGVVRKVFWTIAFVTSLFIGSWPAVRACSSHGFRHVCYLTPAPYNRNETVEQYFWVSMASFLLLLSFENVEVLQRPFTSRLAMYMGDISFGFYIVHWSVLHTLGSVIVGTCKSWLPYGYPNFSVGFFVGAIITTPFVVWVGDIHWGPLIMVR